MALLGKAHYPTGLDIQKKTCGPWLPRDRKSNPLSFYDRFIYEKINAVDQPCTAKPSTNMGWYLSQPTPHWLRSKPGSKVTITPQGVKSGQTPQHIKWLLHIVFSQKFVKRLHCILTLSIRFVKRRWISASLRRRKANAVENQMVFWEIKLGPRWSKMMVELLMYFFDMQYIQHFYTNHPVCQCNKSLPCLGNGNCMFQCFKFGLDIFLQWLQLQQEDLLQRFGPQSEHSGISKTTKLRN